MAGTRKSNWLHKWFRPANGGNEAVLFDLETTAKGILLPGRHALWEFDEDFNELKISAASTMGWHLDESGTSTALALVDQAYGVATAKSGASAGNNFQYQWALNTTVHEPVKLAAGKRAWLYTRFKIEDADQNLPRIGCHNATDDPWNAEETDQFQFRTLAADADALEFACGKTATTEVTIALGNLADDTYIRCLAFYDGADTVWAFRYDDSGNLTNSGKASVTSSSQGDLLPDTEMTIAFGNEAVDTGADDLHIDKIYVAVER
jgi:hypothetical protein